MTEFWGEFLGYLIIIPAAYLCIMPVLEKSRVRPKILLPTVTVFLLAVSLFLSYIQVNLRIDSNIPLFCSLVPLFIAYVFVFDVKKIKLWNVFASGVAVFSFGGLAFFYVEAMLDTKEKIIIAYIVNWGISFLFLGAETVFLKKLRWMINNENITSFWNYVWSVPMVVTTANIILIPSKNSQALSVRELTLYIVFEIVMLVFLLVFIILQYVIIRVTTDKAESEKNAQLLRMQASQYEKLKRYIENTSRLRHDFIYQAKTAQSLAAAGETERLKKLLSDYGTRIVSETSPQKYCDNSALNAITAHYAEEAKRQDIDFTTKLNVAQDINISDYKLCSIVGNILDNAVTAAGAAKDIPRKILFAADTKPNGDLYLAVSNTFNGIIWKDGSKFMSTKRGGHGIGLESVKAIVKSTNGYCKFHYDENTFYSEIMLKQNSDTT